MTNQKHLLCITLCLLGIWTNATAQTTQTPAKEDPLFNISTLTGGRSHADWPRENIPYYWPYPNVPPPKWPQAHPDAKPDAGMTREQYFKKLCQLESGVFIYKTIQDVDGFYVVRPRFVGASLYYGKEPYYTYAASSEILFRHRTAIEDPYGTQGASLSPLSYGSLTVVQKARERRYSYIEIPWVDVSKLPNMPYYFHFGRPPDYPFIRDHFYLSDPPDATGKPGERKIKDVLIRRGGQGQYLRYERSETPIYDEPIRDAMQVSTVWATRPEQSRPYKERDYTHYPAVETRTNTLKSRYGVLWRGITRPQDREMGIGGGELIVLDLQTNEILAVHRGFALAENGKNHQVMWRTTESCPNLYSGSKFHPLNSLHKTLQFQATKITDVTLTPRGN
jgi:hypothetical protein